MPKILVGTSLFNMPLPDCTRIYVIKCICQELVGTGLHVPRRSGSPRIQGENAGFKKFFLFTYFVTCCMLYKAFVMF